MQQGLIMILTAVLLCYTRDHGGENGWGEPVHILSAIYPALITTI